MARHPNPTLYWIWWPFGAWKTSYAVSAMLWLYKKPKTIILTNIRVKWDLYNAPNVYFFDDFVKPNNSNKQEHWLLHIFRFAEQLYRQQRPYNTTPKDLYNKDDHPVLTNYSKRINLYIFLDETWIILSQHDRDKIPKELKDYLFQVRKYNVRLFLIAQKYKMTAKILREHQEYVYAITDPYGSPLLWQFVKAVRKQVIDEETMAIELKPVLKKTWWLFSTTYETQYIPQDKFYRFFYPRKTYKHYDTLYLNKKNQSWKTLLDFWKINNYINSITKKELKPLSKQMIEKLKQKE